LSHLSSAYLLDGLLFANCEPFSHIFNTYQDQLSLLVLYGWLIKFLLHVWLGFK